MPYCVNCGHKYTHRKRYCEKCGLSLSTSDDSFASDTESASTRDLAYERSYWHLRRKQQAAKDSNESLQMFIGCVGIVAMLHGLSLMMGPAIAGLLNGPLGWILVAGLGFGALFKLLFDLRYGYSLARSLVEIVLVGVLTYGVVVGVFWYLSETYIKSGRPFFTFPIRATPTPGGWIGTSMDK